MPHFCPVYPRPRPRRPSLLWMFFGKRRSWLDGLYERSYSMKMGEVHLPGVDLYMVNEPALVRRILSERAQDFPKHQLLADALRPLLGDSIFTTNGAQWQRQRAMMEPAFANARLDVAFPRMLAAVEALLEGLMREPDGVVIDVQVPMTHVTADIIFRTIFSCPLDSAQSQRLFEAFSRYQALAPRLILPALFSVRWLRSWRAMRDSRRAAMEIRGALEALVGPRLADYNGGGEAGSDILGALMSARDDNSAEPFSFGELVDQVAMLFLAGHETSASALSWALHLLANAPEVQERLHDEVVGEFGMDGDLAPERLLRLALLRNVFREALRLFPPVGFLARQAACPEQMRGKAIAPGASLVIAPWLIHRHRDLWPEPDAFDPDRYQRDDEARERTRKALGSAYLPFGMGPRVCIGAAFALQEAVLVLAALTRRLRFLPVEGRVPSPVGRLTIRSETGIWLRVEQRHLPTTPA